MRQSSMLLSSGNGFQILGYSKKPMVAFFKGTDDVQAIKYEFGQLNFTLQDCIKEPSPKDA